MDHIMARYKVLILLACFALGALSDETASSTTLKPPDKLILQKSSQYARPETQSSFMSRLASWFYPFGSSGTTPTNDSATAEDRIGGPQYLPPAQKDCNPCNNEPWIPMVSHAGHKTVLNFVPPSSHETIGELRPPVRPLSPQYGPPLQSGPISQYGPPPVSQHSAPKPQYGPPLQLDHPPPPQYGSPPLNQQGPSQPEYGPPPGPPPKSQYGPPPKPQYDLPSHPGPPPVSQYGPPPSLPQSQYGPPKPQYRPPRLQHTGPPPQNSYGPPPSGPSLPQYAPPRPKQFLPPAPQVTHLKPIRMQKYEVIDMRPPPLKGNYQSLPSSGDFSPPPPPPSDSYGAPITGPNADYQIRPEFLPPLEQIPLGSEPIPLPNLSSRPVLPIHNYQNFRENTIPADDVQILPSINVADYVSSIDHPINVVQSPLVELNVQNQGVQNEDYQNQGAQNEEVQNQGAQNQEYQNQDVRSQRAQNQGYQNQVVQNHGYQSQGYRDQGSGSLSENPIIVEDTHTAATVQNYSHTIPQHNDLNSDFIKELLQKEIPYSQPQFVVKNKTEFTPPPVDYSRWEPTYAAISTSMVPPPLKPASTWLHPVDPTKKPKQIQIIIPYINDKPSNQPRKVPSYASSYSTLLPVYSPPSSTEESLWSKFMDDINLAESKKVTATAFTTQPTTQVSNINDFLNRQPNSLPFDIISLQNHIDDWTQQEFASRFEQTTKGKQLASSKKIPDEYFTTPAYDTTTDVYQSAGSEREEVNDINSNLVDGESTTEEFSTTTIATTTTTTTTPRTKPAPFSTKEPDWNKLESVTVSPLTKEKVYIVTPQPNKDSSTPASAWSMPPKIGVPPKFLIRVEPESKYSRDKLKDSSGQPLTVVYSEWPHLINNLQTTTTIKPLTSRHPLLGLMDFSAYTPPPNSTVQTISGHSKVVTVVTPSSVSWRKPS